MMMSATAPPRTATRTRTDLPVAVIGAGPVGLAAAAELLERGVEVVVFEAGDRVAASVQAWGHTRLFSPWRYVIDDAAVRLLARHGWTPPEGDQPPSGRELIDEYLAPLATTPDLASRIRYGTRVVSVSREGMDRTRSTGRAETPFLLRLETEGAASEVLARAVIDCSGTYTSPNPVTSGGLPALSVPAESGALSHALPDVLGADRERFAGRHVMVVGAGHSAANTLLQLATLAGEEPATRITWAVRAATPQRVYGSQRDELADRGRLGAAVHRLVEDGTVTLLDGFHIDDVHPHGGGALIDARRHGEPVAVTADVVVVATGYRPDLDPLREIRLSLDEVVEAPRVLAPLIDPNLHSCGTVTPHGVVELSHPEPDFYIAGMKSYGRAPTFLLLTGYEQVRSIADELAGNHDAARQVQLTLPDTGVCSTTTTGVGCCDTSTTAVAAGRGLLPVVSTSGSCCA